MSAGAPPERHGPIVWVQRADGVVVLTLDAPDQTANVYDSEFKAAFATVVARLTKEHDQIAGVIVTSAKRSFFAGADLNELLDAEPGSVGDLARSVMETKATLRALEKLPVPVVAALNGAALGGGYEIALACHHRIAVDHSGVRIGLPEVTFGLLPGGGGVARSVRLLGAIDALQKVLLSGRAFSAADALAVGLVDATIGSADELLESATEWIREHPRSAARWDTDGYRMPGADPLTVEFTNTMAPLVAAARATTKGAPALAQRNILAAAVEGARVAFDAAMEIETRYFVELVISQEAKNRIRGGFIDVQAVRSGAARPAGVEPFAARRVGIVGAGMMGAGIAYVAALRGLDVVLQDVDLASAERGKKYAVRLLEKAVSRGNSTQAEAAAVLARIRVSANDFARLADCDVVVEAVFENPELKQAVYQEIAHHAPSALLASNTSTLPITELATAVVDPARFIGMHFFSPVDKIPPVEIVVGGATSDKTVAHAIDFARQLGKLPIVVNDGRGFFTSRVIGKFLDEASAMLGEGCAPASIEQAALQAGYPSGPLQLMDEVTFSLPRTVREETRRAHEEAGGVWEVHPAEPVMNRMIDEFGRNGRRDGAGFYDYDNGKRVKLWPGLARHFSGGGRPAIPLRDMSERMLFAEALEAVRCVDDGVVRSFADANVGSMLAIGYPAWTGGVLQYINGYPDGLAGFVARANELSDKYGSRFMPPKSLAYRAVRSDAFLTPSQ